VISSKPFNVVLAALEAAIGHPDMVEFFKETNGAGTFADLESADHSGLGRTGLLMFMKLDHGAILRRETGLDAPKIVRFLIGNPLIMKEMAKRVSDAGSYAPVTILVDEPPDGVHLSYDRMAALLTTYGNSDALKTLSMSRGNWTRRSGIFFVSMQFEEHCCHAWTLGHASSGRVIEIGTPLM
jgi:uncharacterized protein (DUF302 family)